MVRKKVSRKKSTISSVSEIDTSKNSDNSHRGNNKGSSSAPILTTNFQRMTREKLKGLLREQGLPVTGKRKNMVHQTHDRHLLCLFL